MTMQCYSRYCLQYPLWARAIADKRQLHMFVHSISRLWLRIIFVQFQPQTGRTLCITRHVSFTLPLVQEAFRSMYMCFLTCMCVSFYFCVCFLFSFLVLELLVSLCLSPQPRLCQSLPRSLCNMVASRWEPSEKASSALHCKAS